MTGRTNQITVYVTEDRKAELEQRAADQDESVSGVINEMIDRQLQQDAQDAIASEVRAEERIQELMTLGTEQMADIAREIRDMNAKFGAYAIANFEMMKHDHTDHVRQEALTTGARRIRQDLDTVTQELAAETTAEASSGQPAESGSEPRTKSSNTTDAAAHDGAADDTDTGTQATTADSDTESTSTADESEGSDLFEHLRDNHE